MGPKTANRILLAGTSIVIFSVFWLYILEWLKSMDVVSPLVKLLVGLVVISVVATDWLYVKWKKNKKLDNE